MVSTEERRGLRTELWETPYVETKMGEKKGQTEAAKAVKKKARRNASVTEEACEDSMPRGESEAAYNRTEE